MLKAFSIAALIFGNTVCQISPVREPIEPLAPTVRPAFTIGTISPIRTIGPVITISPITSTSTTIISTFTSNTINDTETNNNENTLNNSDDLLLVYILVPIAVLISILLGFCIFRKRKKRPVINNHLVNIDLNIQNTIEDNTLPIRQISDHTYEEVDYDSRYEMPSIRNMYENDMNDTTEYGTQVETRL